MFWLLMMILGFSMLCVCDAGVRAFVALAPVAVWRIVLAPVAVSSSRCLSQIYLYDEEP